MLRRRVIPAACESLEVVFRWLLRATNNLGRVRPKILRAFWGLLNTLAERPDSRRRSRLQRKKKDDVGRIRTYAPEGTRFLVLRDNHSATTPMVDATEQLMGKFEQGKDIFRCTLVSRYTN
jgi:hypothetical protein